MARRVALICGSRKPAPGLDSRSAARELLRVIDGSLQNRGLTTELFDLREIDLPHFDGRSVDQYDSPGLVRVRDSILQADLVVFSVPAYWNGPAGPFKNLLDILGGAAYDQPDSTTPLTGKLTALLVVGADDASAHNAAAQCRVILTAMGAWVLPDQLEVGNLRQEKSANALMLRLTRFGDRLAEAIIPRPTEG